jgi:hypothetical protein
VEAQIFAAVELLKPSQNSRIIFGASLNGDGRVHLLLDDAIFDVVGILIKSFYVEGIFRL